MSSFPLAVLASFLFRRVAMKNAPPARPLDPSLTSSLSQSATTMDWWKYSWAGKMNPKLSASEVSSVLLLNDNATRSLMTDHFVWIIRINIFQTNVCILGLTFAFENNALWNSYKTVLQSFKGIDSTTFTCVLTNLGRKLSDGPWGEPLASILSDWQPVWNETNKTQISHILSMGVPHDFRLLIN